MAKQAQMIAFQSEKRQAKIGVFAIHIALLPDKIPDESGRAGFKTGARLYVVLCFYIHNASLAQKVEINFNDNPTHINVNTCLPLELKWDLRF